MNNHSAQQFIFPEYASEILKEIMKKYNLYEEPLSKSWAERRKEIKKYLQGEISNISIVADILNRISQGKLAPEDLAEELKKNLKIKKNLAMKLAEELKTQLLKHPAVVEDISEIEEETIEDIYREPIK